MSRRRHATLSERDGDDLDLVALERHGRWDPTAGLPKLGGSKTDHPLFGGVADQCGTCHRRLSACEWRQGGKIGPHPR